MPFAIGESVGPYRIVQQLGQGGMATVFKAYHAALDRYVALKVLHPAFMEDPGFLARFQREARVVAHLDHPNIVPIFDYSEHDGLPYLVMKFIQGETLKARLSRGPLTRDEGLRIVEAVGKALSYAHDQGILHRDIKPSNVLLTPDGSIYLADFGLARIAEAGQSTLSGDMLLGTPQYISPEQARGERDLSVATDIYSFGVMLYEIVVGRVPFNADTPFSIIHDHIYTPLPLPCVVNPTVPEPVQRVLLKALDKDPAARFASVSALVDGFVKASRGEPVGLAAAEAATHAAGAPAAPEPAATLVAVEVPAAPKPGVGPGGEGAEAPPAPAQGRSKRWIWIAGGLTIACLCLLGFLVIARNAARQNQAAATQPAALAPQVVASRGPSPQVQAAQTTVQADPGNPDRHLGLGEALLAAGQRDQAILEFRNAGDLAMNLRAYNRAAFGYARAVEVAGGPQNLEPPVVDRAVQSLFLAATDPQTWPLVDRLQKEFPDWSLLVPVQARCQLYAGKLNRASALLDESLRANPADPLAGAVRAEINQKNGDVIGTVQAVEKVLSQSNAPPWLAEFLNGLLQQLSPQ
jgi:serine/threonine-protein kinase